MRSERTFAPPQWCGHGGPAHLWALSSQTNNQPETLHPHLGATEEHIKPLRKALPGVVMHVNGDGWYSWGEAPGTAGNDENTLHVVIETTEQQAGDLVARARRAVPLVAEEWGTGRDFDSVLTAADDWSVEHNAWTVDQEPSR